MPRIEIIPKYQERVSFHFVFFCEIFIFMYSKNYLNFGVLSTSCVFTEFSGRKHPPSSFINIWGALPSPSINTWCLPGPFSCPLQMEFIEISLNTAEMSIFGLHGRKWREHDLTHWGRVTHICVSKLTIIGSDNGLSPGRRQAIIWTNAGILLIRTSGTNFREIISQINSFSFSKMYLKMSSAKWRLFGLGLNELIGLQTHHIHRVVNVLRNSGLGWPTGITLWLWTSL